jgi:hypothetical protein
MAEAEAEAVGQQNRLGDLVAGVAQRPPHWRAEYRISRRIFLELRHRNLSKTPFGPSSVTQMYSKRGGRAIRNEVTRKGATREPVSGG